MITEDSGVKVISGVASGVCVEAFVAESVDAVDDASEAPVPLPGSLLVLPPVASSVDACDELSDAPLRQMVTKLEGYHLYLPESNSGYLLNGTAFDERVRSLLALLHEM